MWTSPNSFFLSSKDWNVSLFNRLYGILSVRIRSLTLALSFDRLDEVMCLLKYGERRSMATRDDPRQPFRKLTIEDSLCSNQSPSQQVCDHFYTFNLRVRFSSLQVLSSTCFSLEQDDEHPHDSHASFILLSTDEKAD